MKNKLVYLPEPKEIDDKAKAILVEAGYQTTEDGNNYEVSGIFVKTNTILDKPILDKYQNLKFVIRAGVGLDNIDTKECEARGVQVFNSPQSNSNSVAEYVVLLALLIERRFSIQREKLIGGSWRDQMYMGHEIQGKTIGLVGSGNIGKIVANYFKALGAQKVLSYDPFLDKELLMSFGIEKCELDEVFKLSDIVSLHLPLNEDTRNLIGTKYLEMMKEGSVLINTARGGVLNENELLEFLESGKNVNFGLDVFDGEPNINRDLLRYPNVVATPHIAAYTGEAQTRMSVQAVENFLSKFKED